MDSDSMSHHSSMSIGGSRKDVVSSTSPAQRIRKHGARAAVSFVGGTAVMCLFWAFVGMVDSLVNGQVSIEIDHDRVADMSQSIRKALADHGIQKPAHTTPPQGAQFRFPSVQERIDYYFGSWINVTSLDKSDLSPEYCTNDILEGGSNPGVLILGLRDISACIDDVPTLLSTYCKEALPMVVNTALNFEGASKQNQLMVLMRPGDGVKNLNLPLVVKARREHWRRRQRKIPGRNILWPFMVKRHYSAVFDENGVNNLHGVEWEEKNDTLVWRGAATGDRQEIVQNLFREDVRDVDVAFHKEWQKGSADRQEKTRGLVRDKLHMDELVRYKYLLSLEGNDVASGLKWMLYSNSVVFMSRPNSVTWAMEDKLRPFVHYIPIEEDGSNVPEMLQWARTHQEECQRISAQATHFIDNLLVSDQAQKDNRQILNTMRGMYQRRFGRDLYEYCHDVGNNVTAGLASNENSRHSLIGL